MLFSRIFLGDIHSEIILNEFDMVCVRGSFMFCSGLGSVSGEL